MSRCGLPTLDTVGGKEADVPGLKRIVVCELWGAGLRLRFPCQRGVVHLHRDTEKRGESSVTAGVWGIDAGEAGRLEMKETAFICNKGEDVTPVLSELSSGLSYLSNVFLQMKKSITSEYLGLIAVV